VKQYLGVIAVGHIITLLSILVIIWVGGLMAHKDFTCFYTAANQFWVGKNPYVMENLTDIVFDIFPST